MTHIFAKNDIQDTLQMAYNAVHSLDTSPLLFPFR